MATLVETLPLRGRLGIVFLYRLAFVCHSFCVDLCDISEFAQLRVCATKAVTSNNWAPRTQQPRKDPLSCVAYPENVCRSKRNGTVFVM
jgi:hypothetical protein